MGIPEIAWDKRLESFLASSIPKLQSIIFGLVENILGEKVDPDGGLSIETHTCAVSSNLSLTYVSIMLDYPRDWLPRKTILILILPVTVLIELFINLIF